MNAVDRFARELETLLQDIAFSGLKNASPSILEKLTLLGFTAKELGMEKAAALLSQFTEALRIYRLEGGEGKKPAALLCGLEFYGKNIAGNL